jgi:glycosyltransferase involved in cell wall biosynthesis
MTQIPLLFLGDAPLLRGGLGRIGRDLAVQCARLPQFRVGYLGRGDGAGGGIADARLPFMQYTYVPTVEDQWGTGVLPDVWRNFARGQRGVIFTIWDLSRLTWFGNPLYMGESYDALYRFLTGGEFDRWGYFAVDAAGPGANGALPPILAAALSGYDRILAYSQFGQSVLRATEPVRAAEIDRLPHGIVGSAFGYESRFTGEPELLDEAFFGGLGSLIGCVMSNQQRKDWGLWARTMRLVADREPSVRLWAHTDSLTRHWDLRLLLETFDLGSRTLITTDTPSDRQMAARYSACALTVLPSLGEGYGYPIVESMMCGTPCVHGEYAAGAEWVRPLSPLLLVKPIAYTMDTRWCAMRPVYSPEIWADTVLDVLRMSWPRDMVRGAVDHLRWERLWPARWERWFVEGAERFDQRGER